MDRELFLEQLGSLLSDISEEEREEALSYYRDYLEDAGPEREQEVIGGLGSPEKVAAQIRAGLSEDGSAGEFTESGYRDERFDEARNTPDRYAELARREQAGGGSAQEDGGRNGSDGQYRGSAAGESEFCRNAKRAWEDAKDSEWGRKARDAWDAARSGEAGRKARDAWDAPERQRRRKNGSSGLLLLILFLCFGLPLAGTILGAGFSIVSAFFGAVFGIFGGLIGLICGAGAAAAGFLAAGVGLVVTGAFHLVSSPAIGLMLIAFAFFSVAAAVLCVLFVKWGCTTAVPGVFRLAVEIVRTAVRLVRNLIGRIFGGEEREA